MRPFETRSGSTLVEEYQSFRGVVKKQPDAFTLQRPIEFFLKTCKLMLKFIPT